MPSSYMAQFPHARFLLSFILFLPVLSLSVSSATLQPFSLCVYSPPGVPLSFCISLSPSVSLHPVSLSSCYLLLHLSFTHFIYSLLLLYFLSLMCVFFFPVAVVLRILPHSQPGPERLWILLQDQRVEKEVAGAVWHGYVSVCPLCMSVHAWRCDKSVSLALSFFFWSQHQNVTNGPSCSSG